MSTIMDNSRGTSAVLISPSLRGHVPVRVLGFHEASVWDLPTPGPHGRLDVTLLRGRDGVEVRTAEGVVVGHLPARWTGLVERELRRCEALGVDALARATLTGRKGERDLCVFLPWPATKWREQSVAN